MLPLLMKQSRPLRKASRKSDVLFSQYLFFSRKTGFINYYGLQRFGTGQVATNHVGLALLKRDWAGAAHLILDPRKGGITLAKSHLRKIFERYRNPWSSSGQRVLREDWRYQRNSQYAPSIPYCGEDAPPRTEKERCHFVPERLFYGMDK